MAMTIPNLNNFDQISFNGIMNDLQKFWLATNPLGVAGFEYNDTLRPSIVKAVPTIGHYSNKISYMTKAGGLRYKRATKPFDGVTPFAEPRLPLKTVSKETYGLVEAYLNGYQEQFDINLTNVPIPAGDIPQDVLLRSLGYFGDVDELHKNALVSLVNDFYYRNIKAYQNLANYNAATGVQYTSALASRNRWELVFSGADGTTTLPSLKATGVEAIPTLHGYIIHLNRIAREGLTHMMVSLDVAQFLFEELKAKSVAVAGYAEFTNLAKTSYDGKYYDAIEKALSNEFHLTVVINGLVTEDDTGTAVQVMDNGTIVFLNIPTDAKLAAYREQIYMRGMNGLLNMETKLPYTSGVVMVRDTTNHIINTMEWQQLREIRTALGLTADAGMTGFTARMNGEDVSRYASLAEKFTKADFGAGFSNGLLYDMERPNSTNLRVNIRMEYSDLIKVDNQAGAILTNVLDAS